MSGFKPPGAGTGAGFVLYTQLDNNSGVYADAAARDVFFAANPLDLARLDADEFLIIKLLDDGSGDIAYQQPDYRTGHALQKSVRELIYRPALPLLSEGRCAV